MKRKITQIGRFFAMAALMLGAASWASAQNEHPSPSKIGKKACTQSWNFNTSWAEDSLKFAANADYWTPTVKGDTVQRYATSNDSKIIKNGELAFTPEGADLIGKTKGLIFTNLENSSGWKKNHITFRIHMDPGLNCIQTGKKVKLGFKESPKVGEIIEIVFQSANSSARGWASWTGVEPLFEGDADAHDGKVETRKWRVTAADPTFSSNQAIMLHKILVYSETETAPIHVTYLGDEPANYEPVHDALTALKAEEDNKLEITYKGITADSKLTLEEFESTDVLVVGSTITGDNKAIYATLDALVGKLPILNTKVFWYKTKRLDWGDATNASAKSDCIVPQAEYKDHPLFAGLVKGTVADRDTIKVIEDFDNTNDNPTRYLQGYSASAMKDKAPAHTLLGVSTGNQNAFAESWSRGCPYMLIAIDSDMKDKGKPALTDNGKQIIANAINYLANATVQQPAGTLGTCGDPEIAFEKANPQGNTDSDTMRYVVKITVAKVQNAAGEGEIDPTVMITIGSGAAKKYDFDHPDTIWESCTVKAKATALLYEDSKEVSAEFTANLRELKAPEFEAVEVEGKGYKVSFKTYKTTIDNEVTQPTIRYSLDGGAEVVYDPAKDSIISTLTAIVRAWASLMYHEKSEVSETVWNKPGETATTDPTISATNVAGLFTITITGEEGSKIYYTLDGTDPRTSSTKEEYNNAIDCEVFENPVTVKACALADGKVYSSVVEKPLTNENPITLSTPTIAVEGGSFTIASTTEGAQAGSYAIYYTTNGSDPGELNGLIYTDKVTYKGGDKFKVKAIAIGKGYKPSGVTESTTDVTPTGEATEFSIPLYQSTFNREDPSVRTVVVHPTDPVLEEQCWGWFRWEYADREKGTLNTEPKKTADYWFRNTSKHTVKGRGNEYVTEDEWNCGIYYDDEDKPRPQIFENDSKGDWRKFNNWVFWKDNKKGTNSSNKGGQYRRILLQSGLSPNNTPGFSGGALYIFNYAAKAVAGPDSLLQGPFKVVVNIGAADKLNGTLPADVNVCVANDAMGANEMVLGTVSCEAKAGKSDTLYYYGDQQVYVRLTTESESALIFDFQVFSEGAPLEDLTWTIDPEAGATFDEAKEVQRGLDKITVTFNNPITVTEKQVKMNPMKGAGVPAEGIEQIDVTIKQGEANEAVLTLSKPVAAEDGTVYQVTLPSSTVADAASHTNEAIRMFYKVNGGAAAIDEVSAAKEVVATYIYSISGAQMNTLAPGVNIVKKVYSDGTTTTEKVQVK